MLIRELVHISRLTRECIRRKKEIMEVLGKFGINPILLFAQIVNFLIILYIVKRFALKPIMAMLKNREKTIRDGLKEAEEARKLLAETAEKEKQVLKKAQTEARLLLDETKKQAGDLLKQSETRTKSQVDKMLVEARQQISFETKEAEKRLAAHVSELAIEFLEKSTSELFDEEEQNLVMQKAVKNLKKKSN